MTHNAPPGAFTAQRLFNSKLRPKGAAKSAFVPTEEENPSYRPAINPRSRKVSSALASIEERQFDEQHKRQVRLSQLAQAVESERKAHETFAPRTNKAPQYINLDARVPLSERSAPTRNAEQPLDPEATHRPKINSDEVDKEMVALNAAVRRKVRELWAQHAEGTTMSVSGILGALADLGVREPAEDATEEALDKYDAIVDKFLAAMGVDESVEELRYAQYDRFCKVVSTVAKSALQSEKSQSSARPSPPPAHGVRPTTVPPRPSSIAPQQSNVNPPKPSIQRRPPNMHAFSNKQFDVEDGSDEEELVAPQRGMRSAVVTQAAPLNPHTTAKKDAPPPSVSPKGRSGSESGGFSASLDYFRSPSSGQGPTRGRFADLSPSMSPTVDSVEVRSPSPQNPTVAHRHRDPTVRSAPPTEPQTISRPSSRQATSTRASSRSLPGPSIPIPQRLGSTQKPSAVDSENPQRPGSRSGSRSLSHASIQRLYHGTGPNSSVVVQEEFSFKPSINPQSNDVERKRAELGGLLRSRMSSKTLERQERIAREMQAKELTGCTFAPETVTRRPPTVYKFKGTPERNSPAAPAEDSTEHGDALPADPPGFDKAIQRMAEGRKRAIPKFEELLRTSIAVTTNPRPTASKGGRPHRKAPSTVPSDVDEVDDNGSDVDAPPVVTEPQPFTLHAQQRVQERREHRLLLYVDVDLPNGKSGRIGVHRGDDPETLSHNFCVAYSLDSEMKSNLTKMLAEKIEVTLRAEEVRKNLAR